MHTHLHDSSVHGEDSHAGVGQDVQTEHAQTLDESHGPLQGHLLPAANQHGVQAPQHDDDIIILHPLVKAEKRLELDSI